MSVCALVAFGVTLSPFSFNSGEVSHQLEDKINPSPKVKKVSTVALSSSSTGRDLTLSNPDVIDQLLRGTKKRVNFGDAGVKFGAIGLTKNDILTSPCQNETYYLLRFVGNGRYTWENGKTAGALSLRCHRGSGIAPYSNLNNINLKWSKPKWHGFPLSSIYLNRCFFTKSGEGKLKIICDEYGGGDSRIEGIFDEESYKHE